MKKRNLFPVLLFLLLGFMNLCKAQTLEQAQGSRSEKIEKTRKRLLDAIIESDIEDIRILYGTLLELDDSNFLSIYPAEKWLINYWIKDYQIIIDGIKSYDPAFENSLQTKVQPADDYLYYKLKEKTFNNYSVILDEINRSAFSNEKKDILALNLDFLISRNYDLGKNQSELNSQSNVFLTNYPNSQFEKYIREYIRYEFKPSPWGLAFEFFTGYGMYADDLGKNFTNNIPIGVAFDISYKKYVLFLRNYIGFSKTKKSIDFDGGTWLEDSQARVFLPEASIGYLLLDSEKLKFMPFIGIASTSISPTDYDRNRIEEYDNVGLDFTTTYCYGINLDFAIPKSGDIPILSGNEQSYWFIRLRYSYNQPQFSKKYEGFDGNFHNITIGFGGFGRKLKRDY